MGMWEFFRAPAREIEVCRDDLLVSMLVLARFVEARDPYTGGHLWRVSRLARGLAQASGLSRADVAKVTLGGLLHDLGKIAVPDHVVRKPDKLDDGEYALMKTHPEAGWRMLASHPLAFLVEGAVRAHHERPDGLGYPLGLKADEIPWEAEIVGICDAFDAMTSARPYRLGMPVEKALSIMEEGLGKQFSAELGRQFVALGRAGKWDHIVGHSDEGLPLGECMNCAPMLTLRCEQRSGARIFCANCAGEYEARWDIGRLALKPTGRRGAAQDLTPAADIGLIHRLTNEIYPALSLIPTERGRKLLASLRISEALTRRPARV